MPKRRMTAKRKAAVARWQAAGVRARHNKAMVLKAKPTGAKVLAPRYKYKSKGELPHVRYHENKKASTVYAEVLQGHKQVGYMEGFTYTPRTQVVFKTGSRPRRKRATKELFITDVWKTPYVHSKRQKSASVEPGASLLTAAARMSPRQGFTVVGGIREAWPFYEIMGGEKKGNSSGFGADFFYGVKAKKRLAGRRIVRVSEFSPYSTPQRARNRRKYLARKRKGGYKRPPLHRGKLR